MEIREKTAISGIFPVLKTGKLFFSENSFQHIDGNTNTHLKTKYQEKLIIKFSKKFRNTAFSGTFPDLTTGKNVFSKVGLRHNLGIIILHLVPNFRKFLWSNPE